jgi:oligoendopeptidase F
MAVKKRSETEERYKWNLEHIINGSAKWEELFNSVSSRKDICLKYKGKLNSESELLNCLQDEAGLSEDISKLYIYAKMKSDEDTAASEFKGMVDRAEMLYVTINSLNSFIVPEITKMDKSAILSLAADKRFTDFSVLLEDIARTKDHVLNESEEKILAESGIFASGFQETFNVLNNADIKFGKVKDEDGNLTEINHGAYSVFMQSDVRRVRKAAFKAYYKGFIGLNNTIANNYAGNVKKNCFYAKVRKYESALSHSLDSENVDKVVYDKLLLSVSDNVKHVRRYVRFRKKALGVNRIHMYDMYVPLIKGAELKKSYEEAYDMVVEALAPLGKEYIKLLNEARKGGWIDVYETRNKRSGAYSWGVYGAHPYVLLNYRKTTHDIFTIAHELGHAMHSYYSGKAQPFTKASYEIFVAEVASTVNEILMLKHLMKTDDANLKKYLLSYLIDMFRTTLFRQTQFAEFEARAHAMVEEGTPLTTDNLNSLYYDLNVKYYGKEVSDDEIKYEWSRIPHFYNAFYVYKYATGIISACSIADKILNETGYTEKYYRFLSAGRSLPPQEILKLTDVDLTLDEPYDTAMKLFKDALDELISLYE